MTKFDYYWPEFAMIGEQEVLSQEIYASGTNDTYNRTLFGFNPRYSEYKYRESSVHGDFRSSLAYWHMGRIFEAGQEGEAPGLTSQFIKCTPTNRIFAVQSGHNCWMQVQHHMYCARPLPRHANPGYMDHF